MNTAPMQKSRYRPTELRASPTLSTQASKGRPELSALAPYCTFLIVSLTFVLFRAGSLQDAFWIYGALVTGTKGVITVARTKPLIAILMVVAYDLLVTAAKDSKPLRPWLRWSCYYAAIACIIAAMIDHDLQASPDVQQFIYFKF